MASLNSSQGLCLGWVTMRLPTGAEIAIVPPHIHITWEEPFSAALYVRREVFTILPGHPVERFTLLGFGWRDDACFMENCH